MAMFDKPATSGDSAMSPGTVVGGNVKLTGTLKDVNDITVHGQVEGEIISDRLVTVAETARVKGPVTATTVMIAGAVNGDVTASERCELLPSAQVTGSITTADLSIKSGAVFNGKSTMTPTEKPAALHTEAHEETVELVTEPESTNSEDAADSETVEVVKQEEPLEPSKPTAELED